VVPEKLCYKFSRREDFGFASAEQSEATGLARVGTSWTGFASFAASRDLRFECPIRKRSGGMRLEQKQTERTEAGIGWAGLLVITLSAARTRWPVGLPAKFHFSVTSCHVLSRLVISAAGTTTVARPSRWFAKSNFRIHGARIIAPRRAMLCAPGITLGNRSKPKNLDRRKNGSKR